MDSLRSSALPLSADHTICRAMPVATRHDAVKLYAQPAIPADLGTTKIAASRWEREAALRLVHEIYVRHGLTAPHPRGLRVMRHHLSDRTDILIVKRADMVEMTSTLVQDAEYGLPLESLFSADVAALRRQGFRLGEISCLASEHHSLDATHRFTQLVDLISLTFQAARYRGIDRLLLAVHPKHAKVYKRLFGCTPCTEVRRYAAVQGNPAIMCMHDFAYMDQNPYPLHQKFYHKKYAPSQLAAIPMTDAEKRYFGQAVSINAQVMVSAAA